jgi:hypothetical protein
MKKLVMIVAVCLSIKSVATAQNTGNTDNREKFQVGLRAGLNYSNVYDSKGEEFKADAKFGFVGGGFLRIPIGKYFGIQPEVLISQKGFKATGNALGYAYQFTRTTTYLDVPLLLQLKPSEFFTIVAGPQFSYLLNQRDAFTSSAYSYLQEQEFNQDNARKNIFGVVGGLDINLRHVVLGARVNWDVQNNNGDGSSSTPRYKNVWFQGTIGYSFYSSN